MCYMCLSLNVFLPCQKNGKVQKNGRQQIQKQKRKKQKPYIDIILRLFLVGKEKDMTRDWLIAKTTTSAEKTKIFKKNKFTLSRPGQHSIDSQPPVRKRNTIPVCGFRRCCCCCVLRNKQKKNVCLSSSLGESFNKT